MFFLSSAISPTSPQRRSDENVYRSSTVSGESSRPTVMGRSLSNEKFPRSGSWNSHVRKSSPVLPSKYIAPDRARSGGGRSYGRSYRTRYKVWGHFNHKMSEPIGQMSTIQTSAKLFNPTFCPIIDRTFGTDYTDCYIEPWVKGRDCGVC